MYNLLRTRWKFSLFISVLGILQGYSLALPTTSLPGDKVTNHGITGTVGSSDLQGSSQTTVRLVKTTPSGVTERDTSSVAVTQTLPDTVHETPTQNIHITNSVVQLVTMPSPSTDKSVSSITPDIVHVDTSSQSESGHVTQPHTSTGHVESSAVNQDINDTKPTASHSQLTSMSGVTVSPNQQNVSEQTTQSYTSHVTQVRTTSGPGTSHKHVTDPTPGDLPGTDHVTQSITDRPTSSPEKSTFSSHVTHPTSQGPSTTTTAEPIPDCLGIYNYRCRDSNRCISIKKFCDGEPDCPENEDESDTKCHDNGSTTETFSVGTDLILTTPGMAGSIDHKVVLPAVVVPCVIIVLLVGVLAAYARYSHGRKRGQNTRMPAQLDLEVDVDSPTHQPSGQNGLVIQMNDAAVDSTIDPDDVPVLNPFTSDS